MGLLTMTLTWLLVLPLALALTPSPSSSFKAPQDAHTSNISQHGLQARAANLFIAGISELWPDAEDGYAIIEYCFITQEVRNYANDIVKGGISIWTTALGGDPGPETRYRLFFRETLDARGSFALCYTDQHAGNWNPVVPVHALAIRTKDKFSATVGYQPGNAAGRHHLDVSMSAQSAQIKATYVAHELGHVFGMHHEHQRLDRDEYVLFRCENLKGLGEALRQACSDNPNAPTEAVQDRLCTDVHFANSYGLLLKNFHNWNYARDGSGPYGLNEDTEFDIDSIMMYGSSQGGDQSRCEQDLSFCPLLARVYENGVKTDKLREIYRPLAPSEGDLRFVRKWYGW